MLTNKDIKKLKDVFVTRKEIGKRFDDLKKDFQTANLKLLKETFTTQKDLEDFRKEMRESFVDLQTSVDNYAKKADTYFQEMVMLSHKVDRMEKWIYQIAKKVGLELKA